MKHRTALEQEAQESEARPEMIAILEQMLHAYWIPGSKSLHISSDAPILLNTAERRWLETYGFRAVRMGDSGLEIGPYPEPAPPPEPKPRVDPPVPFWGKFLTDVFWTGIAAAVIGRLGGVW